MHPKNKKNEYFIKKYSHKSILKFHFYNKAKKRKHQTKTDKKQQKNKEFQYYFYEKFTIKSSIVTSENAYLKFSFYKKKK